MRCTSYIFLENFIVADKSRISMKKKLLIAMMAFGIAMGLIFPAYATLFVQFKEGLFPFFFAGCIGAGLFVGGFCFFLVDQIIYKVFRNMAGVFQRMEKGDLTERVNIQSSDELGRMINCFNQFAGELTTLIKHIRNDASTIAGEAAGLASVSGYVTGHATQMTSRTQTVSQLVQQMAQNSHTLSVLSEQMATHADSIATAIEEVSVSIGGVELFCNEELALAAHASGDVQKSKETITRLISASKSVGSLLTGIKDIAKQTNLLALNAAIEAATAGDAGKGFTIVAGEVKLLAMKSAGATDDITQQIETMQGNADVAVENIVGVANSIGNVDTLSRSIATAVNEQSKTVNNINTTISNLTGNMRTVANNINECATGLKNASHSVTNMNESVEQTTDGVTAVQKSADTLGNMSDNLLKLIGHFNVDR